MFACSHSITALYSGASVSMEVNNFEDLTVFTVELYLFFGVGPVFFCYRHNSQGVKSLEIVARNQS